MDTIYIGFGRIVQINRSTVENNLNRKGEELMNPPKVLIMLLAAVLLLSACGAKATSANGSTEVKVTLSDFTIQSSITDFKTGVPYHFVVTNNGQVEHEIMLMKPMDNSAGMSMEEMDKMALAYIEADDLPPGGTATFDYTFTEPAAAGELELACHLPGHYEAGMKLPITVN
jgi:uncharacterized cupredoxin-like copper-binding protein